MREKIAVIIIVLILLTSGGLLLTKLPQLNLNKYLSELKNSFEKMDLRINEPSSPATKNPSPTLLPTFRPKTTKPTPKPSFINKPLVCYRFKITHLDGTTSNLCYSQADNNQLINLSFDLSSAQSFYQFHLDGVNQYQALYEKTGSSVYLDAKARSQSQADSEKVKIDSAQAEMYNIERRGY